MRLIQRIYNGDFLWLWGCILNTLMSAFVCALAYMSVRSLTVTCWITDHYHPCSYLKGVSSLKHLAYYMHKSCRKTPIIIFLCIIKKFPSHGVLLNKPSDTIKWQFLHEPKQKRLIIKTCCCYYYYYYYYWFYYNTIQ